MPRFGRTGSGEGFVRVEKANRLKEKNNYRKKIEDIVEIEEHALSLDEIEYIATDTKVRQHYEKTYEGHLYSSILMSLTHKSFSEDEAKKLWNKIANHMRQLNHVLGRHVGIAVASLDYLSNIKDELSEPKIIEENKSAFVAEATTRDTLTGLYSRDVFMALLKKEIAQAARLKKPLCLIMIDIDDFKTVNDKHGHLKGDDVLKKIGSIIDGTVRDMDLAARYGGEEMAVIMPNTDSGGAFEVADRIRNTIEQENFDNLRVTVSIGLCEYNELIGSPQKLIQNADAALYRAKGQGKNRVETHLPQA